MVSSEDVPHRRQPQPAADALEVHRHRRFDDAIAEVVNVGQQFEIEGKALHQDARQYAVEHVAA